MTDQAATVLAQLQARGETLATAESLTGGLLGATLTGVSGSSRSYRGGVIPYATELKTTLVGVSVTTLAEVGPVAAKTAAEMAAGVRDRLGADWGLALTGVAGPDAQDGHPVGQVFVGISGPAGTTTAELRLEGDRSAVRRRAVIKALAVLSAALDDPRVVADPPRPAQPAT